MADGGLKHDPCRPGTTGAKGRSAEIKHGERDPQALEGAGSELLVRADGARRVVTVRRIDAGRDDERLLSAGHAIAQPWPDPRERLRCSHLGPDLLPPFGFTVIALPIKIHRGSAGFVRAVALVPSD